MTRPEAMRLCREMNGHWPTSQIRSYLAEHGVQVSARTIKRWGDPPASEQEVAAETERARVRRQSRRIYQRMQRLHDRGLTYTGIAIVLSEDLGVDIDGEQVRYSMHVGYLSRGIRNAVLA